MIERRGRNMKFEKISIKNFRNFENIEINVSNKNIFFGLNDIGKTNFLYALRYVFDRDIRKNGLIDSDFHKKNTSQPIEITLPLILAILLILIVKSYVRNLRARSLVLMQKSISNWLPSTIRRNFPLPQYYTGVEI